MRKIIYFNRSRIMNRVFASLEESHDLDQYIITPNAIKYGAANSDYDNFNIKKIITLGSDDYIKDAQKLIDEINPDVLVQTELVESVQSLHAKRVFVNHGIMHKSSNLPFKKKQYAIHRKFDMYCGETKIFGDFINHIIGPNCNIKYHMLPQLDLLNSEYCNSFKSKFLKQLDFSPDKIILFCVSCCKDIPKFTGHNEDYFETIFELNKIAPKNNWLVIVKPRYNNNKMIKSASNTKWGKSYAKRYSDMLKDNNKHLWFLDHEDDIYRYLFSDVVLLNGTSTFEVESIVAGKPTVAMRINKRDVNYYDPFESISRGVMNAVKDIGDLEAALKRQNHDKDKQKDFIDWYGILADGLAHKRLQDAIFGI